MVLFNLISFQAIPFLLELRSVLDWVCTDTSLTLYHWLKMEDIYANIYVLKCYRESEKVRSCMGYINVIASGIISALLLCILVPIVQSSLGSCVQGFSALPCLTCLNNPAWCTVARGLTCMLGPSILCFLVYVAWLGPM